MAKCPWRRATVIHVAPAFDYSCTAPKEDTWVRRRPLNDTIRAVWRRARRREAGHRSTPGPTRPEEPASPYIPRVFVSGQSLRHSVRSAGKPVPRAPSEPIKTAREDNPPIRAARARGAAGFCPHGANVAAAPELHREADRPAGRERAVDRRDRQVFRAVTPLHGGHDDSNVRPGGHVVRVQPPGFGK